jgi:hypothetical protein
MKFKVVTLLIVILIFITAPTIMCSMGTVTIKTTTTVPIPEEEENHKHYHLDAPDFLVQDYKKHLFIFPIEAVKLTPHYFFTCCNGFVESHCPPPDFLQYIS